MLTRVSGIWLHLHPSDIPMIPLLSLMFMPSHFLDIHSWNINKDYVHMKNENMQRLGIAIFPLLLK